MLPQTVPALHSVHALVLIAILLSPPVAYLSISYAYLVHWHKRSWLLNTVIHENGRLTLLGSLLYFDHFVACVPMITLFALCAAGGVAVTARVPSDVQLSCAGVIAAVLLGAATLLTVGAFAASVRTVGWQRTMDYALQRIERDGVLSKGGNWNQLQLSNVPIALATIGVASALQLTGSGPDVSLFTGGMACIAAAVTVLVGLSLATWCEWAAFRNPRWLAHSMREVATFPLTGIPIALASIVLTQVVLSGPGAWSVQLRWPGVLLIGAGAVVVAVEFAMIRNVDVLAIAQKPSFAAEGMSIPYLLAAHVFEHMLDFVLIALLAGGVYALLCWFAVA